MRGVIAQILTLESIQRFKLQRQHVQMTSNVAVSMMLGVKVKHGGQVKVPALLRPVQDLAHGNGQQVRFPSMPQYHRKEGTLFSCIRLVK